MGLLILELFLLPYQNRKKYRTYSVLLNKMIEPAFHCAWWGFFVAYINWFAVYPLLSETKRMLNLTQQDIWMSSIARVSGTIFVRFLLGPLCDKYGSRVLFAMILCLSSIPMACTGFIESATGLAVLQFFMIGIVGGTLDMCEYWTRCMFAKRIVSTANASAAGWGNLGAGIMHLVVRTALFPLFKFL
jgi:NNP family nitrate/nitrite transporter-like MFS transporter